MENYFKISKQAFPERSKRGKATEGWMYTEEVCEMPCCENIDIDWGLESIQEYERVRYFQSSGFSQTTERDRLIGQTFAAFL